MIQGTDGVNNTPEQEIMDLRRYLADRLSVKPPPFPRQGKIVMVEDGPLRGVTGILKETADERLLILSIELIRRSIAVRIDRLSRISFRPGAVFPFGTARISS